MDEQTLLDRCRWPELPHPFDTALREAVEFIIHRYATVVGIVASGTIVRGRPDPSSDLDIYVIQQELSRQRVQRFFNSVPAEIFVNPPAAVERYFTEEGAARRPLTAHMLATGFTVLATDPVVDRLCAAARGLVSSPPEPAAHLVMSRYMVATAFEDAVDVVQHDEATARMLLGEAVQRALEYLFLRDGRYIPRKKELLAEISTIDRSLGKLVRRFYSAVTLSELLSVGQEIVGRITGEHGFFEWETDLELLDAEGLPR